jgi:DDE family transposase
MRSLGNLRDWLPKLLPAAHVCAREAARELLCALMIRFTVHLTQLGRQTDRDTTAKSARQFFSRWLARPDWEEATIYAHLNRCARRVLARKGEVAVLIDYTYLENQWAVLQVSIPWQGRALPIYRAVYHRTNPEVGQTESVRQACQFLRTHLPGPQERYVLVMDRGFPSHPLVWEVSERGWRFALRVNGTWKMTHPGYTGLLADAAAVPNLLGPKPRLFLAAVLGTNRGKGREDWSRANVVMFHGIGYTEPWIVLTSERRAGKVIAIYRQRMQIECEFRDIKGPLGLDELAKWQHREHVARFLAMVAVYEWRLAMLWLVHRLADEAARYTVKGKLSWIRLTREWLARQVRLHSRLVLDYL